MARHFQASEEVVEAMLGGVDAQRAHSQIPGGWLCGELLRSPAKECYYEWLPEERDKA